MTISIIAAVARNGVIGKNNQMPWYLPNDLKYFKNTTLAHHVIMGRKNFEAEGKPLPKRENIIVTRQEGYQAEGCTVVHSLGEALELAKCDPEPFIIGGGNIYRQALPMADKLYLTRIDADIEGDVYFPAVNYEEWKLVWTEKHQADERNKYDHEFQLYERKEKATG